MARRRAYAAFVAFLIDARSSERGYTQLGEVRRALEHDAASWTVLFARSAEVIETSGEGAPIDLEDVDVGTDNAAAEILTFLDEVGLTDNDMLIVTVLDRLREYRQDV